MDSSYQVATEFRVAMSGCYPLQYGKTKIQVNNC